MRTDEEILNRIRERRPHDVLGFEWLEYLECLPFALAREFLNPEADEQVWNKYKPSADPRDVTARMVEYMPFAWEKANSYRGLSASRSILHYQA